MRYKNIQSGIFLRRLNRFIGEVLIDNEKHIVHIKNTGRCRELLIEGRNVWLEKSENPLRKTAFDLVCVEKIKEDNSLVIINMDSQIVNDVAEEWLKKGNIASLNAHIYREVKYKNSRFDFYIEDKNRKIFLEVKGVTLENGGVASFPDAPTQRGIKHINELIDAMDEGYEAYILFVIQMKGVTSFVPNDITHKAFGDTLRMGKEKGVKIIAMDCIVTPNTIEIDETVETKI